MCDVLRDMNVYAIALNAGCMRDETPCRVLTPCRGNNRYASETQMRVADACQCSSAGDFFLPRRGVSSGHRDTAQDASFVP